VTRNVGGFAKKATVWPNVAPPKNILGFRSLCIRLDQPEPTDAMIRLLRLFCAHRLLEGSLVELGNAVSPQNGLLISSPIPQFPTALLARPVVPRA
jgi:hypothetical protein